MNSKKNDEHKKKKTPVISKQLTSGFLGNQNINSNLFVFMGLRFFGGKKSNHPNFASETNLVAKKEKISLFSLAISILSWGLDCRYEIEFMISPRTPLDDKCNSAITMTDFLASNALFWET